MTTPISSFFVLLHKWFYLCGMIIQNDMQYLFDRCAICQWHMSSTDRSGHGNSHLWECVARRNFSIRYFVVSKSGALWEFFVIISPRHHLFSDNSIHPFHLQTNIVLVLALCVHYLRPSESPTDSCWIPAATSGLFME